SDFWSIEGLYRFKQEWEPRAEALMAQGEKLPEDLKHLIALPFGLPKDSDITRDEAYKYAKAAILDSGFDETTLSLYGTQEAYLDHTSDEGYYKFCFTYWAYPISDERRVKGEALHEQGLIPQKIIVCVNAVDGQMISMDENNDTQGVERLGI
ncbi:MAG: hypothetical protein RSE23_14175, partial [Clostridia bacterium]